MGDDRRFLGFRLVMEKNFFRNYLKMEMIGNV